MKTYLLLSILALASCECDSPDGSSAGACGDGGADISAGTGPQGGGGSGGSAMPSPDCIQWRPVPISCARASDCWRDDCSDPSCVAGSCQYTAHTTEAGYQPFCHPDRPGTGRWSCWDGYCCPHPE